MQKGGYNTKLLIFPLRKKKIIPLPKELRYLKKYLLNGEKSRLSFFYKYYKFGPDTEECIEEIIKDNPDIVFISCFAFAYAVETIELIRELKRHNQDLIVTAGGAGVSVFPYYFLNNSPLDFLFKGEAEISLPYFLQQFQRKTPDYSSVPNLYIRKGNSILEPAIFKQTTAQDLSLISGTTSRNKKTAEISVSISRGCSKKCNFCSNFICHGSSFRIIPSKKLLKEFSLLPRDINIKLNFEDDNLLLSEKYYIELLSELKKARPGISFYNENGIDYTLLNKDNINKLINLGMKKFNLAIGSLCVKTLERENRTYDFIKFERILSLLEKRKIPCITYFICGLTEDTINTVADTLIYLASKPTITGISMFYAVPGITGYENINIFDSKSPRLCAGTSAFPWNDSLTTQQLITSFRLARFINLLKSPVKTDAESLLINTILEKRKLFTYIRKKGRNELTQVSELDNNFQDYFFDKLDNDPRVY